MKTRLSCTTRAGRALAPFAAFAVALVVLWSPASVGAAPATATDPDDVSLRLDVKTAFHDNAGSTITYTVETYESFADDHVDFKWFIDRTGDGALDLIVSTEWDDGELVAAVENAQEDEVADASVSRPAGNAARVTFSTGVLQGATAYSYQVSARSDLNGNGETDRGEQDLAPNTGWYQHSLAAVTTSSAGTTAAPAAAPPAGTPPGSTPSPGPAPSSPAGSSASAGPSKPAASKPSSSKPAPLVSSTDTASTDTPSVAGASESRVLPASAAPDGAASPLARTGGAHDRLARLGAAITLAGLGLLAVSRSRVGRRAVPVTRNP